MSRTNEPSRPPHLTRSPNVQVGVRRVGAVPARRVRFWLALRGSPPGRRVRQRTGASEGLLATFAVQVFDPGACGAPSVSGASLSDAVTCVPVPEPSSFALLIPGLGTSTNLSFQGASDEERS